MNDSTTPLWLQVPEPSNLVKMFGSAVDIPAFGGRLEVNWAPGARVTSVGGLAYFATFLKATGLFDRLCADFPVEYVSNNASSKRDIVGTAVLAILLGKTRYVHIEAIRHDEAAKELLGLDEIVSDATVRRAFKKGSERELDEWLSRREREVYEVLLSFKYILDIDNTVKPVFGHQEGAELGYNPAKPGRPSHNYHSFFIGRARISPGVHVDHGKNRRERAKTNHPPHFHPCGIGTDPAGSERCRGVLQMARFNCRAVGRKDAMDARRSLRLPQNPAPGPRSEALLRAQVALRRCFTQAEPGIASDVGRGLCHAAKSYSTEIQLTILG